MREPLSLMRGHDCLLMTAVQNHVWFNRKWLFAIHAKSDGSVMRCHRAIRVIRWTVVSESSYSNMLSETWTS